ncbi:MAG TPA: DinB family protein [Bacteroidia bacterium]|jgi:hypothetical protein|nr:DinB family protein [Bacteroidia bacterium]
MNHGAIITKLEESIPFFRALLENTGKEESEYRIAEGKWTIVEVVSHLYDEEREDFRTRLKSTLEDPAKEFAPIDPAGWVRERNYSANKLEEKLPAFFAERKNSIGWLRSLQQPKWTNAYDHPKFGKMSAEMFLSEWYSHDLLHLRQITSIRYHYHRKKCGGQLTYAGTW